MENIDVAECRKKRDKLARLSVQGGAMPSTSMNNTQIEAIANALKENTGATVIEGKVGDGNPNPHIRDSLT